MENNAESPQAPLDKQGCGYRRIVGIIISQAGLWACFLVRYPDGMIWFPPMLVSSPEFYAMWDLAFPWWAYPIFVFMILFGLSYACPTDEMIEEIMKE